ncbi:MAG: SdpI family protein [Candidatus Micrarchaeia archaeon]
MNWMHWTILLFLLGSVGISAYYYDAVPDQMATHWNAEGEPDGYMDKEIGLFLMPGIMVVVLGFVYLIPYIDPLRKNIEKFRKHYEGFIFIIAFFFAYIHAMSIAWNLGYSFDITRATLPVLGIVFLYLGILCGKAKRNWFIGIRTPWTMSSEKVWNRTHKMGKAVFLGVGLLWIIVGILAPQHILWLVALLLLAVVWLVADSYLAYKRLKRLGKAEKLESRIVEEDVPVKPAKKKSRGNAPSKKKTAGKKSASKKKAGKTRGSKAKKPSGRKTTKKKGSKKK